MKSINGPLPAAGSTGDFVFVVAGDNRPTALDAPLPRVLTTIFEEIGVIHPDLVLWTGDTVYGYGHDCAALAKEYEEFEHRAKKAGAPIFNAPGNHEVHDSQTGACSREAMTAEFVKHFGGPYGSFDYMGVHFIGLNTEEPGLAIPPAQLQWLKNDLEAHKDARAIFVFDHTETTPSPNDEDVANHPPLNNSGELQDLFAQYHVKAVFQGHEHLFYQTTNRGVLYYVAGGAGASKYAPPQNGGFSHYVVVEMKGNTPAISVVEPGLFYVEHGTHGHAAWLINSSDIPLPARRVEFKVPDSVGPCADLVASTSLKTWKGQPIPVPVTITNCTTSGNERELTLAVTGEVPRRSSVPIDVARR